MNQNSLGVTDIEHFHWSLSEADVLRSFELENRPVSVPAAVELAIIEANSRRGLGVIVPLVPEYNMGGFL
jgi:hypothetical protein